MTEDVFCPKCDDDVEVPVPWGDVSCPACGLKGYWDEWIIDDDYDFITIVVWEKVRFTDK